MAVLCKLTGHALPYRCGNCRGFCIEQVGMTTATMNETLRDPEALRPPKDPQPLAPGIDTGKS
jgi:hypothetical protein